MLERSDPGGPRGRRPLHVSHRDPAALIGAERSGPLIGNSLPQMTYNLFGRVVIGGPLEATAHARRRKSAREAEEREEAN